MDLKGWRSSISSSSSSFSFLSRDLHPLFANGFESQKKGEEIPNLAEAMKPAKKTPSISEECRKFPLCSAGGLKISRLLSVEKGMIIFIFRKHISDFKIFGSSNGFSSIQNKQEIEKKVHNILSVEYSN